MRARTVRWLWLWLLWLAVVRAETHARVDRPASLLAAREQPQKSDIAIDFPKVPRGQKLISSENGFTQSLKVICDVKHRYAVTTLISQLENLSNETQESKIVLLIPESAFISSFSFIANDVKYQTTVKSIEEAKREYEMAVGAGESSAQVSSSSNDLDIFTISVNVEPRSSIFFNLTYDELLSRKNGLYDINISLTPKQILKNLDINVNIKETSNITKMIVKIPEKEPYLYNGSTQDVRGNFSELRSIISSNSAKIRYHPIRGSNIPMTNESNNQELNYLLRVQYDVNRSQSASEILFGDGHFVHFFAPENFSPVPLHIIFVLDTSTSMWGRKIEQLQISMQTALGNLRNGDHFSLIHFGNDVGVWSTKPQDMVGINRYDVTHEVNAMNIEKAKYFISTLNVTGGTNINSAVQKALEVAARHKINVANDKKFNTSVHSVILLLSDGIPTIGELRSFRILAATRAKNTEIQASIFSLAIGENANFAFLKRLSLQNHGFARKLYEASDTAIQLESFFEEISSPLLTNINFIYTGRSVLQDSLTLSHFHSYFKGSEIIVAGKLKDEEQIENPLNFHNEINAQNRGNEVRDTTILRKKSSTYEHFNLLERLWAYLTIQQLINQQIAEESSKNQTYEKVAREIALKHGFVTPLTSMIVKNPHSHLPFKLLIKPNEDSEGNENFIFHNKIMPLPMSPFQNHHQNSNSLSTDMVQSSNEFTTSNTDTPNNDTEEFPLPMVLNISDVVWLPQYLNAENKLEITLNNDTNPQIFLLDVENPEDVTYKECSTPNKGNGVCQPFASCILEDFKDNYNIFLKYFCALNEVAGVCCPAMEQKVISE